MKLKKIITEYDLFDYRDEFFWDEKNNKQGIYKKIHIDGFVRNKTNFKNNEKDGLSLTSLRNLGTIYIKNNKKNEEFGLIIDFKYK